MMLRRAALPVLLIAMALIAPAATAKVPGDQLEQSFQPIDMRASWSVVGHATHCFSDGECADAGSVDASASFHAQWAEYPLGGSFETQDIKKHPADGKAASCKSNGEPEARPTSTGTLSLNGSAAGLQVKAVLFSPCLGAYQWLKDLGAPTEATATADFPLGRELHPVLDGSKTYTGTNDSGDQVTITVTWHVDAYWATPCTGFSFAQGTRGWKAAWGRAPFCLLGAGSRNRQCLIDAIRRGTVTCNGRRAPDIPDARVCSLASRAQIARAVGSPIYIHTDHPLDYCFYRGRRGNVSIYRAFGFEYRPEAEWTSWGKLLAARGYGHYHVGRAGGGRVLEVVGTRPWVHDWYAYKRNQVLFFTFVDGKASINPFIRTLAGQMLARL